MQLPLKVEDTEAASMTSFICDQIIDFEAKNHQCRRIFV
ncbi:hypothetical protein GXM_09004 [Nostoc sphaeroides CCNUC1]|uniref:Uncharacterized protein n=1 Tax=Nostoc sphaeroides CCNUC1 TaxID=2653204 RepID=A0A5P8WFY0_9NOSO|nr:hypothetical protein GXM_09004 [Nostoc sphaeroides CCNUC1]